MSKSSVIISVILTLIALLALAESGHTTYEVVESITIEQAITLTESEEIMAVECTGLYSIFVEDDTMILVNKTIGLLFPRTTQIVTTTYNSSIK